MTVILYILTAMIFYDFSLHFLRLILGLEQARKLKFYWPIFLIGNQKRYEIFWTIYWGTAFILTISYIIVQTKS